MGGDVDEEMKERKPQMLMDALDRFQNGYNVNAPQRSNTWI